MSETQVMGGTITSPSPAVSRRAARVMRFAEEPEFTSTLYSTPSHRDHSSSNARTCTDCVKIGPPSPSAWESMRMTSAKSARVTLFFINGQSRKLSVVSPNGGPSLASRSCPTLLTDNSFAPLTMVLLEPRIP